MPTKPSSAATSAEPRRPSLAVAALRAMRPGQWTKNAVVVVPWFFAFWDHAQRSASAQAGRLGALLLVLAAFCLLSSGIYLLNDLCDVEEDRRHPVKRHRPIAAGVLPLAVARALSLSLLAAGLLTAALLSRAVLGVLAGYVGLQALYNLGLKRVGQVDVFVIATGFVLRVVAGAAAVEVYVSGWLLLCTFWLALFLACCKRRHEKAHSPTGGEDQRAVLARYDLRVLDQCIAITAAATLVCYAVYTLAAETVAKFNTHALGATVPFVAFGVFRYLDLTYRQASGDRPEKVLLTDPPMVVTVLLYAVAAVGAFVWGQMK